MTTNPILSDKPKRKRRAAKEWRVVFSEVHKLKSHRYKKGFSYSQILEIAGTHGISIERESLRVKIQRYRKLGYVKQVTRGRYQILPEGHGFFGLL